MDILQEKTRLESGAGTFDLGPDLVEDFDQSTAMARRAQDSVPTTVDLNLLLLSAWEHGARHLVLRRRDQGMEISFLDPDGVEHQEVLSLSYPEIVKGLRQITAHHGRVHLDMAGHQWNLQAVVPATRCPDRVFVHLHPADQ